ncbi:hypothetical protein SASPL_131845 [Salvia splendens]|uniref:Uncharacterized protein n=1 Tax=Salvia splendens TaxID=180675 RepID=A0A8X8X8G6_SALSN|nr:hypothetical protein SASPL_131845 [Salvia splendens]
MELSHRLHSFKQILTHHAVFEADHLNFGHGLLNNSWNFKKLRNEVNKQLTVSIYRGEFGEIGITALVATWTDHDHTSCNRIFISNSNILMVTIYDTQVCLIGVRSLAKRSGT